MCLSSPLEVLGLKSLIWCHNITGVGTFRETFKFLQGRMLAIIMQYVLLVEEIIIVLHSRQHQSINLTSDPRLRDEDPRVHGNPKKDACRVLPRILEWWLKFPRLGVSR